MKALFDLHTPLPAANLMMANSSVSQALKSSPGDKQFQLCT